VKRTRSSLSIPAGGLDSRNLKAHLRFRDYDHSVRTVLSGEALTRTRVGELLNTRRLYLPRSSRKGGDARTRSSGEKRKGRKHTALKIAKNRTGQHSRATQREVVEVVRELARRLPDGQIARILNRLGYQTGVGNGFTANRVVTLRNYHGIEVYN
jgi:hypothetical protein